MKAYRAQRLAGLEMLALEDLPAPLPPTGAVAIAVRAAGLHLADFAALAGDRAPRPEVPFTPGLEVAGTVVAGGAKGLKKGQRVVAFVPWGGLAEQALTPAELCVPLPDGVDDAEAASLPIAYAGAIMALRDKAGLVAGETVLVLGAGGHIGLAAVEVAKQLGARVIAAAGGEARGSLANTLGADHLIDTAIEPLDTRAREFTGGKGVDVIFDPVGGDAFEAAIAATATGARIVSAGFAGGRVPRINVASFFARDLQLMAANMPVTVQSHPSLARAALLDAVKWAAEKSIHPRIAAKFALTDARHAFEYVKGRKGNGAVIVTMG
jgi:NADPH2:quinone reductase